MKSITDLRKEFGEYTQKMLNEYASFGDRYVLYSKDITIEKGIAYCSVTLIKPSTGQRITFKKTYDILWKGDI